MAYNKTTWVNGQTKLSAPNMNHIENGIATADTAATAAGVAAAVVATDLETTNATVQALTSTVNDKQDKLISGTNIKTFNGNSILEAGNINFITSLENYYNKSEIDAKLADIEVQHYEELSSADLNTLVTPGIYSIATATNVPENTGTAGLLEVKKLDTNKTKQEWLTNTNRAMRVLDNTPAPAFYVNGVATTPVAGVIELNAGGVYTLSGTLAGHINIGDATEIANNYTRIILAGVNIKSTAETAINYLPASKSVTVEIKGDTQNFIEVESSITTETSDFGVIHSNNNMVVAGTGYLNIKNNKGHAIKASKLEIKGNPYIYINSKHDGLHGGSLLKVTGGTIKVLTAKDAISSSEGSSNDGEMCISGGIFDIVDCQESVFEGKSLNGKKQIYGDTKIILGTALSNKTIFSAPTTATETFKLYDTITIENNSTAVVPDKIALSSLYSATPSVKFVSTTAEESVITAIDNIFTLSNNSDAGYYKISGNFSGYKILATVQKVDIEVNGIYYKDTSDDTGAFIEYTATAKRLKLKLNSGFINYINKKNGYCIKSAKNIQITSKGDLFISCQNGYSIYAPSGDTVLAGDGSRYITNSKYGIITNLLTLGEDLGDVEEYISGAKSPSVSDDAIYVCNNTDYDVYTITKKNSSEQLQAGAITAAQYHTGIAILGNVVYKVGEGPNILGFTDQVGKIEAINGPVKQTGGQEYTNLPLLYSKANDLQKINVVIYTGNLPTTIINSDLDNNQINSGTFNTWTVYGLKGLVYTKAEVDTNFVSKAAYDTAIAAVTPKKVSFVKTGTTKNPIYDQNQKITAVNIHKFACPERLDNEPETEKTLYKDGTPIYGRDGDFGYTSIDGTGQLNFSTTMSEAGYVIVPIINRIHTVPDPEKDPGWKSFKTPYATCISNIYRITKLTDDLNVTLNTVKEDTLESHTITYKFGLPEGYPTANLPDITVFRCEDTAKKYLQYKDKPNLVLDQNLLSGKKLTFTGTIDPGSTSTVYKSTDHSYNKDTGYLDKGNFTTGTSQARVKIDPTKLLDGYKCEAWVDPSIILPSGSLTPENYSLASFAYDEDLDLWTAKKIAKDFEISLIISPITT